MGSSDTKAQIINGVFILLGVIIGSLATYWMGESSRKKQKETDEIKEQRLKVRTHEKAMKIANAEIEGLLVLILKNIEHYKDIQQGILNNQGQFRTTISMPQPYPHQARIGANFMNINLDTKWRSFESEIVLQNANLTEFNEYYIALRSSAHEALLMGANLNVQVLNQDNKAIKDGAAQCITASESFKERCFLLQAEIELGAKRWRSFDFTKVMLQELMDYMEKIRFYKPKDKQLKDYVDKELRPVYRPEKAFKSASEVSRKSNSTPV